MNNNKLEQLPMGIMVESSQNDGIIRSVNIELIHACNDRYLTDSCV